MSSSLQGIHQVVFAILLEAFYFREILCLKDQLEELTWKEESEIDHLN